MGSAYAFDASPNIRLLTKGLVDHAALHGSGFQLFRQFDILLCLTAAEDYGVSADRWSQVWVNIDNHATQGAILSCGTGENRKQALEAATIHAPTLQFAETTSSQLDAVTGEGQGSACVFWRR